VGILSLLPPFVVFVVGIWTRNITRALASGFAAACLIATNFSLFPSITLSFNTVLQNFHFSKLLAGNFPKATNIHILFFVVLLGILIEMIMITDSAKAFVRSSCRFIKNQRGAQIGAVSLSHLLCMDDYLSSLTSGAVFRPIADKYGVTRARLAFLTDSMAAPLTLITPISSWAAAILGYLTENGVGSSGGEELLIAENPYSVYLQILPYIFYSFAIVTSVWFIVGTDLRSKETLGFSREDLKVQELETSTHVRLVDFIVPIFSLLISTAFLLLWLGGWQGLGGEFPFSQAIWQTPISFVLFLAGTIATSFSACYYFARKLLSISKLWECAKKGSTLMFPVILMLILSWSLGDILQNHLHTGGYLAGIISGAISIELLPLVCFLNALISMALGSSWATAAIMFPIAIPMVLSLSGGLEGPQTLAQVPILVPCFGAILSGAVCGDHLSLISETTFMAAASAGCEPFEHFKTQFALSVPALIAAFVAHTASGYLSLIFSWQLSACICLAIALGVCLLGIVLSQWRQLTKRHEFT